MFSNSLYPEQGGDRIVIIMNQGDLSNEQWERLKPLLPYMKNWQPIIQL
ncbi:hypothetical protein F7734_58740 [Scytonema sp. UIC 10036]|nr:hypothetical protein [Scytonema sp. UIC 10036]MUH01585.1 hypothetical protein [Scytonema sp. UIC 10036]